MRRSPAATRSAGRDAGRVDQLQQGTAELGLQILQVRRLEGLDDHVRVGREPAAAQGVDEHRLDGKPDRAVERRVLDLGEDADAAAQLAREAVEQVEDLVEGEDLVAPVPERVVRAGRRDALDRPQRLELGEGEVDGEPAVGGHRVDHLRRAARRELGVPGDVGGAADLRLVARDEVAVAGGAEVDVDGVRPEVRRERVRRDGVLGAVAGRAPVPDDRHRRPCRARGRDDRRGAARRRVRRRAGRGGAGRGGRGARGAGRPAGRAGGQADGREATGGHERGAAGRAMVGDRCPAPRRPPPDRRPP